MGVGCQGSIQRWTILIVIQDGKHMVHRLDNISDRRPILARERLGDKGRLEPFLLNRCELLMFWCMGLITKS